MAIKAGRVRLDIDSARNSAKAVEQANQSSMTIQSRLEAAQRIGDVVSLISSVAGQTNLLALNATIEAARAGDAGPGGAVVAREVKTLAARTAKATDEIAQQILAIQSAIKTSVQRSRQQKRSLRLSRLPSRSKVPRPPRSRATCRKPRAEPGTFPAISTASAKPQARLERQQCNY
jgi:hypothetical protein